jgi:hypothetical protein
MKSIDCSTSRWRAALALALAAVGALGAGEAHAQTWMGRAHGLNDWYHEGGIARAADGGYAVFGTSNLVGYGDRVQLLKLDAAGEPQWARGYDLPARAVALEPTADGGYLLLAHSLGTDPGAPTWSTRWVARVNATGDIVQQALLERPYDVMRVVGGSAWLATSWTENGFTVTRLDVGALAEAWSRDVSLPGAWLNVNGIDVDASGRLLAVGHQGDAAGDRIFLARFGAAGALEAVKLFSAGPNRWINVDGVLATPTGPVVGAYTNSGEPTYDDLMPFKLTAQWRLQWRLELPRAETDWINSMTLLPNGDVLVGGSTRGFSPHGGYDFLAMRLEGSSGRIAWQKRYWTPEEDELYFQVGTPDGGALLAGRHTQFGSEMNGTLLARIDGKGSVAARDATGASIPCPYEATTTFAAARLGPFTMVDGPVGGYAVVPVIVSASQVQAAATDPAPVIYQKLSN